MHNAFLASAKTQIDRHGKLASYVVVTEGNYNVETGSVSSTTISYAVKIYKRHIKANQYNYPTMVGQDAAIFYLANYKLSFTPAVRDKIIFDNTTYVIDSIVQHSAGASVVLYKLLAVRG